MPGLNGNTIGVGRDIVDYLTAVANHFELTIVITSGHRDPAEQAVAMFKYWTKLKRGSVYSKRALPEDQRKKLDTLYKASAEDPKADSKARSEAKSSFLELAKENLGNKSKHAQGRAVDITQESLSPAAYRALALRLKSVREGSRRDIYHFESETPIPKVNDDDKKSWAALSTAPIACVAQPSGILAGLEPLCSGCA